MRAAELANLDPVQALAAAIGERDLAGARDLAAVIDARLRYRIGALVPALTGLWSAQVPAIADPERRAYAAEDPDYGDLGPAFPPWPGSGRDAIMQPPKPEITPSPQVL